MRTRRKQYHPRTPLDALVTEVKGGGQRWRSGFGPSGEEAAEASFSPDEGALSETDRRFPRSAAATTPYECATRRRARKDLPAVWYSSRSGPAAAAQRTQCRLRLASPAAARDAYHALRTQTRAAQHAAQPYWSVVSTASAAGPRTDPAVQPCSPATKQQARMTACAMTASKTN